MRTALLLCFSSIFLSQYASAAAGTSTGTIESVVAVSNSSGWSSLNGAYIVKLNNVTQAGSCHVNSGLVQFFIRPEDKELFSMVLAAKMSGNSINIDWDDSLTYGLGCQARDIILR